ncbi:fumarylacetoacetate hydrolase family protein [Thermomicrobium sp. 4228-Ro]|uniref:fumarylacetoacetate hydrolase family protein n=1 Tax=Thermomicrobium sp. 4228-Ro TaxID=2993937 RepID=UPI002248849A|nr:fumarylacetoacetate hydrolase family protein [Thermomicrobium sp. 4228-Ro]MCX2728603.1 fumarylacetoacetate hydrolase family protein [Thermomicrobium sp. 4228-Ro]
MRTARFIAEGRLHIGTVHESCLVDEAGRCYPFEAVTWLPPVEPRKIIGVVLNYAEHAQELGMEVPTAPVLFFKPTTALIGHRAPIVYPTGVQSLHYEVELAVVIGKRCRKVARERAFEVVRGYTVANDVTARDFITNYFRPPVKAKGFDTFCPLGPWLVDAGDIDPDNVTLRAYVNGELRQEGHTSRLIYKVADLIAYISEFMTLEPDDVIMTGTPEGISFVKLGDVVRVEVEGIGGLENQIVAE